jgi:hypothetical protein
VTLQQVNDELDFELRALAQTSPRSPAKQLRATGPSKATDDGITKVESTPTANSTEGIHTA